MEKSPDFTSGNLGVYETLSFACLYFNMGKSNFVFHTVSNNSWVSTRNADVSCFMVHFTLLTRDWFHVSCFMFHMSNVSFFMFCSVVTIQNAEAPTWQYQENIRCPAQSL